MSAESALPLNRLSYQIAHHNHFTYKTKLYEIIFQIFGRYGAIENEGISLGYCTVFKEDIYKLHVMKAKYLDPVKLTNPFKWLEFLLVAPLELISFSLLRFPGFCFDDHDQNCCVSLLEIILSIAALVLDLVVNIITGSLRRVLAPSRYIIRPAIEMAMKHQNWFLSVVFVTALTAITLTGLWFTSGLPVTIPGLDLVSWTIAEKLTLVGLGSIWFGSMLTKGFDCLREWNEHRVRVMERNPQSSLHIRNNQVDYNVTLLALDHDPTAEELFNCNKSELPVIIQNTNENSYFVFGLSAKSVCYLTRLHKQHEKLFEGIPLNTKIPKLATEVSKNILNSLYYDIYWSRGHTIKRSGHTQQLSRILHHVDADHADVPLIKTKQQNLEAKPEEKNYDRMLRLFYFFGVEAVTCPNKETLQKQQGFVWNVDPSLS